MILLVVSTLWMRQKVFDGQRFKYAYLLFTDPGKISLDDYVFNTEAHPLSFQRKD